MHPTTLDLRGGKAGYLQIVEYNMSVWLRNLGYPVKIVTISEQLTGFGFDFRPSLPDFSRMQMMIYEVGGWDTKIALICHEFKKRGISCQNRLYVN